MAFFISSLIRGMDQMEEIAEWIDSLKDPQLGVELIAFTHDADYWQRLTELLKRLTCPVTFHGPYIGTEATAADGTAEQEFLLDSYERVLRLAAEHGVRHIVYHYTQKGFAAEARAAAQAAEQQNRRQILEAAGRYGVNLLIENLPEPKGALPLYTVSEYSELFGADSGLRSIIDVGHAHMNHMNVEDFLKVHGDRVRAYHFHNNDSTADSHNSIFHGTFDYAAFAPIYKAWTGQADIVLEYEPHVKLTREELVSQIRWLRERYC